jgi:hypothetical protein
MKYFHKFFIPICLIILLILISVEIIERNNMSIDNQTTICEKSITIIFFVRTWDIGFSIVDNSGGYNAFSLAHGFFSRSILVGNK